LRLLVLIVRGLFDASMLSSVVSLLACGAVIVSLGLVVALALAGILSA